MKSLEQIKNEYALGKKFKSWENFCLVANDNMFVRAVDEIAMLYAAYQAKFVLAPRLVTWQNIPDSLVKEHFG